VPVVGVLPAQQRNRFPASGTSDAESIPFSAGFDAFWEADLFGRVSHGIAAARAENQAFEADLHDVQVSVVAELARNYFELRARNGASQWPSAVLRTSAKRCGSRNCAAMPAWVKNKMLRVPLPA